MQIGEEMLAIIRCFVVMFQVDFGNFIYDICPVQPNQTGDSLQGIHLRGAVAGVVPGRGEGGNIGYV